MMTKKRIPILLLAVLTVILLAGCGNDTTAESSDPAGLETWGVQVNPSTAPSQGQSVQVTPGAGIINQPAGNGTVDEGDHQGTSSGAVIGDGPEETAAPATQKPSTPSTQKPSTPSTTSDPTTTPDAPLISPPAPASTATPDQVKEYVGKPLSELIADLGVPSSSDYAPIDEENPEAGEIGTLYFDGFTVTTKRTAEGETITSVNETPVETDDPEPSPETVE